MLSAYLEEMVAGMGRLERRRAMEVYVTGLLLDGERKSIEPMAARLMEDAGEIEAMRQRLQQCFAAAPPRPLSAVPPQARRSRASSRAVTHLIK
nr:transposase [Corallococcus sp. EGB]